LDYYLDEDRAGQDELAAIRQGKGYMNLANGLIRLARLYELHADALARDGHRYRAADRDDASRVAHAIMRQLGEGRIDDAARWSDYVRRAWTLLARIYEQVSAAGRFLFRDENADALFPSLVTVCRARGRRGPGG